MGAARMKDQSDFDLERFIDMFDLALTSNDERVVNALRSLMMMVILTNPEDGEKRVSGPLKRIVEDHSYLIRRMDTMQEEIRSLQEYRKRDQNERGRSFYDRDRDPLSYKWPAQYPTWDLAYEKEQMLIDSLRKINGTGLAPSTVATQSPQIQPLTKKEK